MTRITLKLQSNQIAGTYAGWRLPLSEKSRVVLSLRPGVPQFQRFPT